MPKPEKPVAELRWSLSAIRRGRGSGQWSAVDWSITVHGTSVTIRGRVDMRCVEAVGLADARRWAAKFGLKPENEVR